MKHPHQRRFRLFLKQLKTGEIVFPPASARQGARPSGAAGDGPEPKEAASS
jgi:hypothetical protein